MIDMKKGFGLLEVMAAAVVLGFLIVGLTRLQIGNREAILRVRARDVANNFAQEIIDSIAAQGLARIAETRACDRESDPSENGDLCKSLEFEGVIGTTTINFDATVSVKEGESESDKELQKLENQSIYAEESGELSARNIAKNIDVTVEWLFKGTEQSINLSAVVR